MSEHDSNLSSERLDRAVSQRLAMLRSMPVDTSRLARRMEAQIPRPISKSHYSWFRLNEWTRPLRVVAASVLILGLIAAIIIASSSGPVMASTKDLLRVHQEILADANHSVALQSIQGANAALMREWPKAPQLPQMPLDQKMNGCVMSCCVHRIDRRKMACAALKINGALVSLSVADAADITMPQGQTVHRGGIIYHVSSASGVNMVMTLKNGRWACLMGKVPMETLLQTLAGMKW